MESAVLQKLPQAELDLGAVPQRRVPVTAGKQLGGHLVGVLVLADQLVDVGGPHPFDDVDQIVDAVGVDRRPEVRFGLHLVALGDGDTTHVVAESRHLQGRQLGVAERRARPRADPAAGVRVADVSCDRLA